MTQTREKWDSLVLSRSDFCMICKCHGVPCFQFYLLFRNNAIREQLDENDLRRCYGNLFRKYLVTVMFLVLSQQLQGTLTTALERHFTIEDFTDMDQHKCEAYTKTFELLYCMLLCLKQA